jgi:hypothetical protein
MKYGKVRIDRQIRYVASPNDWALHKIKVYNDGWFRADSRLVGKLIGEVCRFEIIVMCGELCDEPF